ncbi:hypothetical protein ANN_17467 [Periplaneta americana]|uniref:Uncharacterized protein n=1 Tax=Periplaneta americana TaxID=6978 RepID=A0ABQ8SU14_PERAM|nr:hypothetical protein ANN_17467 [Periplaneta americana]
MYPEIPLPPKPILTRWGTWLEAVEYYAEHIDSINNVLLALDSEDAVSIDTAKTVTCDISVKNDLAHIQHTFSCIIKTLKSLQNRHLSLSESFEIINSTVEQLNRGRGKVADAVRAKVDTVLSKTLDMKNYKSSSSTDDGALSVTAAHTEAHKRVLGPTLSWTLILSEEHRLTVFENKVLRKIFGAKRDEVTGEWRKLHNAELHALYSSPDVIRNIKSRRLRWTGHIARMGESRNAYRVLVGRPEGKRPLGRPRRRWEDNIKMDLREVEYDDKNWINLAQDRDHWRAYVRAAMNLRKTDHLLRIYGKRTKEETSKVHCMECGIVWVRNMEITMKRREEKRREEKRREEKRREEKRREEKRREEKRREVFEM